jgi:trk system potassium uptake protein TrkH
MADMGAGERLLASLFASVTPRTAGFNTIPTGEMSSGGTLLTMVLMLIGAGPGSTGGGLKVTTVFILVLAVISRVRNSEDMNIYERRLDRRLLHKAATSASIYLLLSLIGSLIISAQGLGVTETVYEALSAIGTVGLSTGVTTQLSAVSRIVIILLMFVEGSEPRRGDGDDDATAGPIGRQIRSEKINTGIMIIILSTVLLCGIHH